ncbi:glycosyltransferase [Neobacillus niacini]|uniref:glycosyltransferase n=1 Tax=Neobacillus niacini TaxID=86668 RepID=UPI003B013906
MDEKRTIICFPGTLYDKRPFTNRQRVMQEMNKLGYRIIYVEPPKNLFIQLIKFILGLKKEQNTFKWLLRILTGKERTTDFYIFSQLKFLPLKQKRFRKINNKINSYFLVKYLDKLSVKNPFLWIYTPDAVDFIDWINNKSLIYDCVDEYSSQPWYIDNFDNIQFDEELLLKRANIVFTSATKLYENKKKSNPNTFLIENVADFNHFNKVLHTKKIIPNDINDIKSPIIGFVGALDKYKLDYELVTFIAKNKSNWNIVLIGPHNEAEKNSSVHVLKEYDNIKLLGSKSFDELPYYVNCFDVCIIPYVKNEYTEGCFPLKFFEYFSCGKPVVVSGLPALDKYSNYGIKASTNVEFIEKVESYITFDDDNEKNRRIKLAKENTWNTKAIKMSKIIHDYEVSLEIRGE